MSRQAVWNKYEVALLIDTYLKVSEKGIEKLPALIELSRRLRSIATNAGIEIDDTYRNLNGMQWQYAFIERAFQEKGIGSHKPPKLFLELVRTYKTQPDVFNAILLEAYKLSDEQGTSGQNDLSKIEGTNMTDNKTEFRSWLQKQPKLKYPARLIISVQSECSDYAVAHHVAKVAFWNLTDAAQYMDIARKLRELRLFRVTHRKAALTFDKTYIYYSLFLKERMTIPTIESKSHLAEKLNPDENILIGFSKWLLETKGTAMATSNGYASNLRSLAMYCEQTGIAPSSFITAAPEDLQRIVGQIMQNNEFQKYNAEQHNRFSAALKKFLEYRTGVVLSTHTPKSTTIKKSDGFHYREQVAAVLREHYPYGFRLESIIDMKRFRRYAEEQNAEIPVSDDALRVEIRNAGIKIDDKMYFIDQDTFAFIRETVETLTLDGSKILFYDCIYDSVVSGMENHYITSADQLKSIMKQCKQNIFDDLAEIHFAKNFVSLSGNQMERDAVTMELQRVWGEKQIKRIDELAEQLPAIPAEYVRRHLSGSTAFVWVSDGTYFNMQRFIITENEKNTILSFVADECDNKGYASISDVPLGNTAEENYELSDAGLQEAIYNAVLQNHFHLNGKILTKDNRSLDVVTLVKQYLADKDECTFDEADQKVQEIAGTRYRYMAYDALYNTMIRVDKNRYVAHRHVKFDIDVIDGILSEMINDKFLAIKEITSFALFPVCGYPWNHYLLESYCYSYSKRYCLKVVGFNDKNAGIIAENNVTDGYNELLAQAAARAKIELSMETVGQYYFETGYMGKRTFADLESIVQHAQAIREDLL